MAPPKCLAESHDEILRRSLLAENPVLKSGDIPKAPRLQLPGKQARQQGERQKCRAQGKAESVARAPALQYLHVIGQQPVGNFPHAAQSHMGIVIAEIECANG